MKMFLKNHFIKATEEYNTFEKNVPAYYFRRTFAAERECAATITVAVCGFYELYFNGTNITKGLLSPYISNTNDYIYYDEYDITLDEGENVIALVLGNGFQNNPGGYIWDFDKADFRSAPMFALSVSQKSSGFEKDLLKSDENFKIAPSPIRSDDYRFGEYYDANYEIQGWNQKGFNDSVWKRALPATAPRGELRLAEVAPIIKEMEIKPLEIIRCGDGFIYDFGVSNAGNCRLSITGTKGQKVELRYADSLKDGDLDLAQIWFVRDCWERDKNIVHKDTYICKGIGKEIYQPTFTYHGFRYAKVTGITEEQATESLLTYLVYHTRLNTRGDFRCSDRVATALQEITRRSVLSNFYHFPTDCPQREKNGWTADAALSCEVAMLNFDPEQNYREWIRNVCKAQRQDGSLPGIVPTDGWGFHWGNGPAWDCVLAYLPYYVYIYRGKTEMITDSAHSFLSYLQYLRTRCDEDGLLSIGLGDWCHVGGVKPKAPLVLTDTVMSMDIADKMAVMFEAVNMHEEANFARSEAAAYKYAIRTHLIDFDTMIAKGACQSGQAMCLYYGVFDETEKKAAFNKLLEMIHDFDDHIDVGVLGGRVIFHVLAQFGCSDLAYKMITREDYPSYGNWLKRGATTLWEDFYPNKASSMNHHFWGDISAWFIKNLAGIQLNPNKHDVNTVEIKPSFLVALDYVSAYHIAPSGKISVSWKREGQTIILEIEIPDEISAVAEVEMGFGFEDGSRLRPVKTGTYRIIPNVKECKLPIKG